MVGEAVEGRRRAPEKSVLHEAFRRGWPEVSSSIPSRVKLEVERYLTCGDLRFGFMEVTCQTWAESRLVAYCCKSRGWCPSCTTRRALDTGIHLESVLPRVAHRQWTLSLPFSVRFNVASKPQLLKRLEVRLVKAVWRWQRGFGSASRRFRRADGRWGLLLAVVRLSPSPRAAPPPPRAGGRVAAGRDG